ncbi:MAG: tRNA (guanosine(37)-N1)-methyltransferase TrmD [Gammaproteobacteria bacterium]|nr:tRNA (guanosine(37)-N1)-methyltransferase TrmD [Gammaproteobacteria bacterium]
MRFDVISLFPPMFDAVRSYGMTRRAIELGLLDLHVWNPREFTTNNHRSVDDRPYGGGPGMVMMMQPLQAAIRAARDAAQKTLGKTVKTVYMSPQGQPLLQGKLKEYAALQGLILLSGRYEGIDERVIQCEVDEECSLGDYVLSGGELAAMVIVDGVSRLLPGVLGHEQSAEQDSFENGLLDYPHYTRPEMVASEKVPGVLLSGDHQAIERWRMKQALGRTWLRRPALLAGRQLDEVQKTLLEEFIREQNTQQ